MVLSKRLLVLSFVCVALVSHPVLSQLLLVEDFSSASQHSPPEQWETLLQSGVIPGDFWSFDDPYIVSPLGSPSGGKFATFPGFFYSEDGKEERVALVSPWVDVPEDGKPLSLAFHHYYFISEGRGGWSVSVRSDTLSSWQFLAGATEGESEHLPELAVFDVSAIVGSVDSVQIKFEGYGQGGLAWILDDVTLAQGTLQPPDVIHEPESITCSLSPEIRAMVPDSGGIGQSWIRYWVDGVLQDSVIMIGSAERTAVLSLDHPAIVEYQIIVEDGTPNRNRGYSPKALKGRHRLVVGSTPSSEIANHWRVGERLFTSTGEPIDTYFKSSRFAFPLFSMDSTSDAINIVTYPVNVEAGFDYLTFRRSYSGYGNISDTLRCYLSTDGGTSWTQPLYVASGNRLRTVPVQETPFVPIHDADWSVDGFSLSPWVNQCIQLRLEVSPGYGNNLYLDSLHFMESPVLSTDIKDVYPNPSSDVVNVEAYIPPGGPANLSLVSIHGQLIHALSIDESHGWFSTSLDVSGLSAGVYAIVLQAGGKANSVLIVVQ